MIRLLADCGNSTVKLAVADGPRLLVHARLDTRPGIWTAWLAGCGHQPAELVLLPGARGWAAAVTTWWGDRPQRTVGEDLQPPAIGQYPGMGLDRVVAGIALDAPALVVDAGTATTLGAWTGVPLRFAGGLIAPGVRACSQGLSAAAPALPTVAPRIGPACQRDTEGSLAVALGLGYPAMIGACVAALAAETGTHRVLVTGGNAEALAGLPGASPQPTLILDGLARLAAAGE